MPKGVYKHHTHQGFRKGRAKTGGVKVGYKHTKEFKQKIHQNNLKRYASGEKFGFQKGHKINVGRWVDRSLSEETKKKISLSNKGKKPWNYIYDRTKLKQSEHKDLDSRYSDWMISVRNRDDWKCKINNKDCKGRIETHHILPWRDFPELRYDINNGITVCHYHHPRKRSEEKRLVSFFNNLISVNKND